MALINEFSTANMSISENLDTVNSIGGVFPVLIACAILFAVGLGILFLTSEKFQRLGGIFAFFGRQMHNALMGLVPAAILAALAGIGYGLAVMPADTQEKAGYGLAIGIGAFVGLAALGAAFKRFLRRVEQVHPEWFNKARTDEPDSRINEPESRSD